MIFQSVPFFSGHSVLFAERCGDMEKSLNILSSVLPFLVGKLADESWQNTQYIYINKL